jgi:hypothetical protein
VETDHHDENEELLDLLEEGDSKVFKVSKMSESQKNCFYFFEHPKSNLAKAFNFISYVLILYSTIEVAIETLPVYTAPDGSSYLLKLPGM